MNPIISMLNNSNQGNLLSRINQIKNLISGNSTDDIFKSMMTNNPQFKNFVESNRGKTAEQIAAENNIDLSALKKLI